jgi:hypothetical protein
VTPPTILHYFRCRVCASVLITGIKTGNYEPCNGCRSHMKFLFSEPVETPEQHDCAAEVAKRGRVFRWSPSPDPLGWTPSRMEFVPDPGYYQRSAEAEQESQERMEAAYRAAEERGR